MIIHMSSLADKELLYKEQLCGEVQDELNGVEGGELLESLVTGSVSRA